MTTSVAERIRKEMADHDLSSELRTRLDEWIKFDKEFNVWFLVTTKRTLADDELMELIDGYRESQEMAETAWRNFLRMKDPVPLLETIAQSLAQLRSLHERT